MEGKSPAGAFVVQGREHGPSVEITGADLYAIADQVQRLAPDVVTVAEAMTDHLNSPAFKDPLDEAFFLQNGRHLKMERRFSKVHVNRAEFRRHEPQSIRETNEVFLDNWSSLKERRGSGGYSWIVTDMFADFGESTYMAGFYTEGVDVQRTMWMALGDPEIRKELVARGGLKLYKNLVDHASYIAGQEIMYTSEPEDVVRRVISTVTTALLGVPARIAPHQAASFFLALETLSGKALRQAFREMLSPKNYRATRKRMIENVNSLRYRVEKASSEDLVSPRVGIHHPKKGFRKVMESMTAPIRWVDTWTITGIYRATELDVEWGSDNPEALETWGGQPIPPTSAEYGPAVNKHSRRTVNFNQPTWSAVNQTGMARAARRNALLRVGTMFKNIPLQIINMIKRAGADVRHNPKDKRAWGRYLKILALTLGLSPAIYVASKRAEKRAYRLGRPDPDYTAGRFATDVLRTNVSLPYFVGDAAWAIERGLRQGSSYGINVGENPLERMVSGGVGGAIDVLAGLDKRFMESDAAAGSKQMRRGFDQILYTTLMALGVPVKPYSAGRQLMRNFGAGAGEAEGPKATDAARELAEAKGIPLASLAPGSGVGGRILLRDVKDALARRERENQRTEPARLLTAGVTTQGE